MGQHRGRGGAEWVVGGTAWGVVWEVMGGVLAMSNVTLALSSSKP